MTPFSDLVVSLLVTAACALAVIGALIVGHVGFAVMFAAIGAAWIIWGDC
jgi:hypothetical protein